MLPIIELLNQISFQIRNIDVSKLSQNEKIELSKGIVSTTKWIEILINKFNKDS